MNKKGFTLVELLVAVAIIAILATIGLTIFSTSQRDARDARRRADINSIAGALEVNKAAGSYNLLKDENFSSGKIPVDTSTAKYSVKTDDTAAVSDPTSWDVGNGNPSAEWVTVSSSNPAALTKYWKVCARLEKSGSTYCRGNAQ